MRYHATVSYDGSRYYGFQSQKNALGIQEVIEDALKNMTQTVIVIHSAGRTDRGVHALGQSFHFDTHIDIDQDVFMSSLNRRLPLDIRLTHLRKVKDTFHARHKAVSKKYVYKLSKVPTHAFLAYYMHFEPHLDYEKIKIAAKMFEGTHDFFGFSAKVEGKNTIKTIYSVNIKESKESMQVEFHGNGFLKYMVRSIMGTIIDIGKGKKTFEDITENFNQPNRTLSGKTAPSTGLYLKKVYYKRTKDWYNSNR